MVQPTPLATSASTVCTAPTSARTLQLDAPRLERRVDEAADRVRRAGKHHRVAGQRGQARRARAAGCRPARPAAAARASAARSAAAARPADRTAARGRAGRRSAISRSDTLSPSSTVITARGKRSRKRCTSGTLNPSATRGGRPTTTRPPGLACRSRSSSRAPSAISSSARACPSSASPASVGDRAAAGADQQALAELGLEQADLPAQAGLRQVERDRGAAEAAGVDDAHEVGELPQVHSEEA